jgi:hypothetical protein
VAGARASGTKMPVKFANTLMAHASGILAYYFPNIYWTLGRYKQQNQCHEKARVRIQRYGILQTQSHGYSSLKVSFSRMNLNSQSVTRLEGDENRL